MSKEADIPVSHVTFECRTLTESLSGRPETIPTTRFHVPASIMAPSLFSKVPSGLHRYALRTLRQFYVRSSTHLANHHLVIGFARPDS
jgi:hypothetical protein